MNYTFEDQAIDALKKYDKIKAQLDILEEEKNKIRTQIKNWLKINKTENATLSGDEKTWKITTVKNKKRSITDYDLLINKLGEDSKFLIKETSSEFIKIT